MSHRIEINYSNPQKARGVVGGKPSIPVNGAFQFFSPDGPLKVQFVGNSPLAKDPGLLADNTDFTAAKPGKFKFKCFLKVGGHDVVLDPDSPEATGGELEVLPG